MSYMYRVYVLLVLLGVVFGADKPCCFPDRWEADVEQVTGSSDDEGNVDVVLVSILRSP